MEDWSKYVFDPKNPKDFKAYGLLKKILKDGNAMLVTGASQNVAQPKNSVL